MKTAYFVTAASVTTLMACGALAQGAGDIEVTEVKGQAYPPAISLVETEGFSPGKETADSLRNILGVSGSRMGGHGTDPTIRGLSQTQLNVLLDGAYVHGGCPNRMDPPTSYAPASNYEKITVIRGTQTLAYGGGGPGGTILFERVTERFLDGWGARGTLETSFTDNGDTLRTNGDIAFGNELGFARIIASYADADNYEDGDGNEVRSAYTEKGTSITLGYTPSADTRAEIIYERQRTEDALFAGAGMDSPLAQNTALRAKFVTEANIGPFDSLRGEVYRSDVSHVMDNYTLRTNTMMQMRAPSLSDTQGGRIIATLNSALGVWTMGIDAQYNERSARRFNDTMAYGALNSVLWPDAEIRQNGVFAEVKHTLTEQTALIAGLRYDRVTSSADSGDLDPPGMLLSPNQLYQLYYEDAAEDRTDHNIGGLLRIEYTLADGSGAVYGGLSRSLRTPDATERYLASNSMMPSGRWVGNPGLEPETHHQLELGGYKMFDALRLEGSVYYNDVADYVLRDRFVAPGNNATVYRNIDARLIGTEVEATWQIDPNWRTSLGLAYVHATNQTDNRAIAQTPPLEGRATLGYSQQKFNASAVLLFAASQPRVDTDSASGIPGQGLDLQQTSGWGVINLQADYAYSDTLKFKAGIDNLLDNNYHQHLNRASAFDPEQIQVNEPGRALWVGATLTF